MMMMFTDADLAKETVSATDSVPQHK